MDETPSREPDLSEALSRLDGDAVLLAELARLFLEEGPKLLASLQTAVNERNAAGIETYAHSLKGSISYFGATHAHQFASALERKGRECDLAGVDELFRQLQVEVEKCTRSLSAIL
jgi:HPt (histidine-containing phosphotransfer) domain-containing protein